MKHSPTIRTAANMGEIKPVNTKQQSRSRIARGIGANLFTQIVIAFIQIALVPTLASHWGLNLYGWWVIISTVPAYIALGDLGFATAAGVDMTMKVARGDIKGANRVYQNTWVVVATLSIVILVVAFSLIWTLPDALMAGSDIVSAGTARATLTVLVFQSLVALQGSLFLAGFRCCGRFPYSAMSQAFIILSEGITTIAIVLCGGSPLIVAWGLVICRTVGVACQWKALSTVAPWLRFGFDGIDANEIRKLCIPSFGVIALSGAQAIFLQGTVVAVGAAMSASSAAVFSSVRTLTRVGVQLTTVINRAVAPEFSSVSSLKNKSAQSTILSWTILSSAACLLPTAGALLLIGPKIVSLWTAGVVDAQWSFIAAMTLVMLLHGLWNPIATFFLAINHHNRISYIYLTLATCSVILAFPLATEFGEVGGALSLLFGDSTMLIVVYTLMFRRLSTYNELIEAIKESFSRWRTKASI